VHDSRPLLLSWCLQQCATLDVSGIGIVSKKMVGYQYTLSNKKHLKNVGPIRHNEPPHAHSADVASGTVVCRLRIDVYDNDNAWQSGPLWPHGMGPMMHHFSSYLLYICNRTTTSPCEMYLVPLCLTLASRCLCFYQHRPVQYLHRRWGRWPSVQPLLVCPVSWASLNLGQKSYTWNRPRQCPNAISLRLLVTPLACFETRLK